MSTMAPAEREGGYFPHWKEKTGGVIMPEERLPWAIRVVVQLPPRAVELSPRAVEDPSLRLLLKTA
jgi:hypothetical protein